MKFTANKVKSLNKRIISTVIGLELLFVMIYLGSILITGASYPAFDMNGYQTIPSLFAAVQLVTLGLAFLGLGWYNRHPGEKPSRRSLWTVGIIFLYIGVLDETFKVHQHFYKPFCYLPGIENCRDFYPVYIYLYIAIAISTFLILFRDLKASWRFYPLGAFLAGLGIFIHLFGALGLELIGFDLLPQILSKFFNYNDWVFILVEKIRITLEEFLEMFGVSIALYSLGLFLAKRLEITSDHESTD
jgi:hypothetical protein